MDVILECLVKEYLNDRLSLNFNETLFEPYYDYLQNIWRDDTVTFDRRDSYNLSKEEFGNILSN